MTTMTVAPISKEQSERFVTAKHYSRRPSIFWAGFGLIIAGKVEGVIVYGQPSPPIQKHAFADRAFKLYELARLVIQTDARNAASFLIGNSLKRLEPHCAVVSYADSEWKHAGIVYQATNWIYTGATISHDHAYIIDGARVHPISLRDRGITNPKQWARDNGVQTAPPMEKHRYFFLRGTRSQRRDMLASLRYPAMPYPKMDRGVYDDGPRIVMPAVEEAAQMSLFA